MNCPKCGFIQEEGTDCKRCGVVFAKFLALHHEPGAQLEIQEPQAPGNGSSQQELAVSLLPQLLEVKQNLKTLQQRFTELEFERAERRRIRSEIRALEDRLQELQAETAKHQEEIRQQVLELSALPASPNVEDFVALKQEVGRINALCLQTEQIERMLDSRTEASVRIDPEILGLLPKLEGRLSDVEDRVTALIEMGERFRSNGNSAQLSAVSRNLDELKTALQNVTVRYTEIGELKKNHLVMRDMIEALQQVAESVRKESTIGTSVKIAELQKEVSALGAEVRKAYEHIDSLESAAAAAFSVQEASPLIEVKSLREEMAAAGRLHGEEQEDVRSQLGSLRSKVEEAFQFLAALPEKVETQACQLSRLDQQYQPLTTMLEQVCTATNGAPQKIAELGREIEKLRGDMSQMQSQMQALTHRLAEPVPPGKAVAGGMPAQDDMCAIRENLDEIRRFMASMSRRLAN